MFFGYKVKVYVGVSNFHQMQRKKKKNLNFRWVTISFPQKSVHN